ncbi:hemerythrin HHE cation bindingdomain-containing protein [Monoraphidium neglectum]|uniref:Hemerythrin HHE cation bindingdomain-containing protein n=1 Tax=Monoraphidium neglectum TaxID=145388 RepID=A0A0D2MHN2_9CHLO|nr:hemerythrin HHE cation bindingdomain-containing protein [Monoraphidium neglectum]KIY94550.1 hemerythrin HHE cation bindingdomain-containing protein [Monoraphidium neglectum]|eukprot:XP_013893570.1 hemerythrin HHE cation bindingdomain-containing protein [Monoraphidium neglectum]
MGCSQMRADAPGFDARVEDLYRALRHHVEDEDEELDKFAAEVDPSELRQLGDKFTSVKGYLPTRPHLNAPDKPSDGLVVADRLTAPIDRLRDAAEQRRV